MIPCDDIRDRLDQALASETGISIDFLTQREAKAFRMALYAFRRQDARHCATIYPEGHALHGRSPYDILLIRIEDESSVIIEPRRPVPPAKPIPDQA